MLVGTSFFKMDGNPYYGPEFRRGGLAATFAVDVTHLVGSPTVTISVEHRNSEDTTFTSVGTFSSITSVGSASVDLSGIKEILRFSYVFDGADDATDGVHLVMMPPSWRPYA